MHQYPLGLVAGGWWQCNESPAQQPDRRRPMVGHHQRADKLESINVETVPTPLELEPVQVRVCKTHRLVNPSVKALSGGYVFHKGWAANTCGSHFCRVHVCSRCMMTRFCRARRILASGLPLTMCATTMSEPIMGVADPAAQHQPPDSQVAVHARLTFEGSGASQSARALCSQHLVFTLNAFTCHGPRCYVLQPIMGMAITAMC